MLKRTLILAATTAAGVILTAVPASAHSHYLTLPSEQNPAQDLAAGEPEAAPSHPLHCKVHVGTPGTFAFDQVNNPVDIQKSGSFGGHC